MPWPAGNSSFTVLGAFCYRRWMALSGGGRCHKAVLHSGSDIGENPSPTLHPPVVPAVKAPGEISTDHTQSWDFVPKLQCRSPCESVRTYGGCFSLKHKPQRLPCWLHWRSTHRYFRFIRKPKKDGIEISLCSPRLKGRHNQGVTL